MKPSIEDSGNPPQISVIIPAYNVALYVGDAIRSGLAQRGVTLEVIVVDDGSTDATKDVLEGFAGDSRVRLIFQTNLGPSAARNTALNASQGTYVGFLDADDLWDSTKAAKHVAFMDSNPRIDVSYSWWRTIDETGRDTGRRAVIPAKRVPGGLGLVGLVIENFTGTASTVICRREVALRVGGFDPMLRSNVDLDLLLRLASLRPHNIGLVPEILTSYRMRSGQITGNWARMRTNWEAVVARAAETAPSAVARVRREAGARQGRYYAYIAYQAGDLPAARRLIWEAWIAHPATLVRDKRAWLTTAAVVASLLPAPTHRSLANAVKSWRRLRARGVT